MKDKVLDAEGSILGSSLLSAEASEKALMRLHVESFVQPSNRIIFETMQKLHGQKVPIDLTTLSSALGSQLEAVGGLAYLAELGTYTPTAANIDYYINLVLEDERRRGFLRGIDEAMHAAVHEEDGYIEIAQKAIDDARSQGCSDVKPAGEDVIRAFLDIGKDENGIHTGFAFLDRLTGGLKPKHVTVVAGRTSMGKTSFAINVAVNVVMSGKIVVFFSLEMPKTDILKRACFCLAQASRRDVIEGNAKKVIALSDAAEALAKQRFYVFDDVASLEHIRSKCWEIRQRERGIDLIVIDYLGRMRAAFRKNGTREQEVSELSRSVKDMAMQLDVPVVLLAQLNRAAENRKPPEPILADLRESGAIEQDADEVFFLYRPSVYGESEDEREAHLFIAKNRYGSIGEVPLRWVGEHFRYEDVENFTEASDAIPEKWEKPEPFLLQKETLQPQRR